jgi:hypothetical protein
VNGPRRLSEQHRDAVEGEMEIGFQRRDQRLRVGQVGLGLGHVERRHQTDVESVLGQAQCVPLRLDVGVGEPNAFLESADI